MTTTNTSAVQRLLATDAGWAPLALGNVPRSVERVS